MYHRPGRLFKTSKGQLPSWGVRMGTADMNWLTGLHGPASETSKASSLGKEQIVCLGDSSFLWLSREKEKERLTDWFWFGWFIFAGLCCSDFLAFKREIVFYVHGYWNNSGNSYLSNLVRDTSGQSASSQHEQENVQMVGLEPEFAEYWWNVCTNVLFVWCGDVLDTHRGEADRLGVFPAVAPMRCGLWGAQPALCWHYKAEGLSQAILAAWISWGVRTS